MNSPRSRVFRSALYAAIFAVASFSAQSNAAPISRYFSYTYGHHSSIYPQGVGWLPDGSLGTSYDQPAPGLVPFNECYVPGRAMGLFFDSTQSNCEGQPPSGGNLGYIAPPNAYGLYGMTRPLFRCFDPKSGDHMTTTMAIECWNAGYTIEGTGVVGFDW